MDWGSNFSSPRRRRGLRHPVPESMAERPPHSSGTLGPHMRHWHLSLLPWPLKVSCSDGPRRSHLASGWGALTFLLFLIIAMELQARLLIQVLFIPWGSWLAHWGTCPKCNHNYGAHTHAPPNRHAVGALHHGSRACLRGAGSRGVTCMTWGAGRGETTV